MIASCKYLEEKLLNCSKRRNGSCCNQRGGNVAKRDGVIMAEGVETM